ncbi:MAG: acetolactate synthase large subunit [Pseudomonas sp.]
MKASDLLVRALENEGVEYIFGLPGEENLDLLESLADSNIRLILTRHEQGAGFMAATYGRLTGKAGVCLSTLGPGITNLVTPTAYAQLAGMPLMLLSGQKPIKHSKQGQFQIIDAVDMLQPLTKFTRQIVNGNGIPALVREAFRLAEEERPGATHLELPEDIAREDTDAKLLPRTKDRRPLAEHKALEHALQLLREARRPLLVIGAGANRKLTAKALRSFVDKQGIPFVTTQMGKGVIDETHPLWLGNAALSSGDFPHRAIENADLILNVGHDVVEKPPFIMQQGERKVVHVNFQPARIDPVYFPQASVVGDIANSLWQLNESLEPQAAWDFSFMLRCREAMLQHMADSCDSEAFPLSPQRLVHDVRQVMPENGIISLDNGIYKIWFARNYPARLPNTVLLDNALASMGAGLPSAMAARLVYPDRPVVAICGDGGFMMNSQEIETAVRLKLDLVVLILNDSAYGMIKWKQQDMGLKDFGLDFNNPCFVTYARSYGAQGHRLTGSDELQPLLRDCLAAGGVHLIDVPIDYRDNVRLLNEEIPKISAEL